MLGQLLLATGRRRSFPLVDPAERFSPREIAGLAYWFDAQDAATLFQDDALTSPVTADGQSVGGWVEKSNGRNVVQATGTLRPLYRASYINGRPAIEADGVDDFLRIATTTLPQPLTIYQVSKFATVVATAIWFDSGGSATDRIRLQSSAVSSRAMSAGTTLLDGSCDTQPHMQSALFNTVASELYVDGASAISPSDAGPNALTGLTLFATRTGTNVVTGGIGELLIYSGVHSASQRKLVESYLKHRWAI